MKLLDKYVEAVGRKLPLKGREDVKAELKSLLLDDIESRYGTDPSEAQLKEVLKEFGSPAEVARRYTGQEAVIAPGLTSLYFFLLKIALGGLGIAFLVVFILEMVTTAMGNNGTAATGIDAVTVLRGLGQFVMRTLNAWFSAVGVITLIFMAITRYGKEEDVKVDMEWSPDELKDIELDEEQESRVEAGFTIGFLSVLLVLVNFYPHLFITAEEYFLRTGLSLGHRVVLEYLRIYMHAISIAWIVEIAGHITQIAQGSKTGTARVLELAGSIGSSFILLALVMDFRIYSEYTSLLGFRAIFLVALVITLAETVWMIFKHVIRSLSR